MDYPAFLSALQFLIQWPALNRAAGLVQQRFIELDGDHYGILTPAAEALSARFPLAATLALRAMIDFTLNAGKSSRYGYAAQHLAACAELAGRIEDFAPFELHDVYIARIKAGHGKKTGFWARVDR